MQCMQDSDDACVAPVVAMVPLAWMVQQGFIPTFNPRCFCELVRRLVDPKGSRVVLQVPDVVLPSKLTV